MNLQDLEILEDDFDLFVALDDTEKIEFLFDAVESGIEASILKQVTKLDEQYTNIDVKHKISTEDFQFGQYRIAVTLTPNEVHLNSNSLKAIRSFTNKMFNDGLMLWPLKMKKSVFDIYRFYKSFSIIGRGTAISSN